MRPAGVSHARHTSPARGPRSAGGALVAALLAALPGAGACGSDGTGARDLQTLQLEPAAAGAARGADPLWTALAAALGDGDDALAAVLLERLRPWAVEPDERERLAAFERILRGRELARSVELRLISEPTDEPGRHRVVLLARSEAPWPVVLRLPPARLTHVQCCVDAGGGAARELHTSHVDALEELALPPGRTVRRVLARSSLPGGAVGGVLACRDSWTLGALAGEWETPEGNLPAAGITVAPCERVRLADHLPLAPVPLEELLRYVREEPIRSAPLVERAVRLSSGQRRAALVALAPLVGEWARDDPERVLALAPALRWLTGGAHSGLGPEEWAAVLRGAAREDRRPRLELGGDAASADANDAGG